MMRSRKPGSLHSADSGRDDTKRGCALNGAEDDPRIILPLLILGEADAILIVAG